MGKVNVGLKRSYIFVTSLTAVISALLLAATLFIHGYVHEDEKIETLLQGLTTMYVMTISNLVLAILGVYGACKEKKWALIVFAVGMILSSLFKVAVVINGLGARPKVSVEMKKHLLEMLPLSNASESAMGDFEQAQMEFQCCGLDRGYLDWGYSISESCLCTEESTNPCVAAPRNSSLFEHNADGQPIMIYSEPCLSYIMAHHMAYLDCALGIWLGVTLLWILSVVLCIVILCKLRRKEDIPVVVYSPEAKAGNYTVLTDAAEYT